MYDFCCHIQNINKDLSLFLSIFCLINEFVSFFFFFLFNLSIIYFIDNGLIDWTNLHVVSLIFD